MVGNRQITLSVARQLDRVNLDDLEPFGRVCMDNEDSVIGRHKISGALAVARYQRFGIGIPHIFEDDLDGDVTVCGKLEPPISGSYDLSFNGRVIRISECATNRCSKHDRTSPEGCKAWSANGMADQLQHAIAEHDRLARLHEAAANMPLIVLAGLR